MRPHPVPPRLPVPNQPHTEPEPIHCKIMTFPRRAFASCVLGLCLLVAHLAPRTDAKYIFAGGRFDRNTASTGDLRAGAVWDEDQKLWLEIGGVPRNLTHPTVHDGSVVRSSHYDIISKQLFIAGVFSRFGERISIQKASVASPNFGRFNTTDYTWHPTENPDEYASPKFVTSKGSEPFVLSTIVSHPTATAAFSQIGKAVGQGANVLAVWRDLLIAAGDPSVTGAMVNGAPVTSGLIYLTIDGAIRDSPWTVLGGGVCGGHVRSLTIINNTLYVAGNFTGVNSTDCASPEAVVANGIATFDMIDFTWNTSIAAQLDAASDIACMTPHNAFDAAAETSAPSASNSTSNATVNAPTSDPNGHHQLPLYVAGNFGVAGKPTRVAKWDGVTWATYDFPATGEIYAIAELDYNIFVGGAFVNETAGILNVAVNRASMWSPVQYFSGLYCNPEDTFCANQTATVYTLTAFPELIELIPPPPPGLFDFIEWKMWSIVLAGCVVVAMVLSCLVNCCFKCCARCKK